MPVAHQDQIPVLVRTNPTIKALVAVGDPLVSRVMISVSVMCVCVCESEQICFTDPIHLEGYSEVYTSMTRQGSYHV